MRNMTITRTITFFGILSLASLCLCGKKRPEPRVIDGSYQYTQKKIEEQRNLPDLRVTVTGEDFCNVVFHIGPHKAQEICFIGSNGKELKTKHSGFIGSIIQVSPDGKKFAYQGYSESAGGRCQVVYDMVRDTFNYFALPDGWGYHPRWWDNENLYYRSTEHVVKQNIRGGEPVVITNTGEGYTWGDPVWVPTLQKYALLVEKQLCMYTIHSTKIKCLPLPFKSAGNSPMLFTVNNNIGIGFNISFETPDKIQQGYIALDLNGKKYFLKSKIGQCEEFDPVELTIDPHGKWLYYVKSVEPHPDEPGAIYCLRRVSIADSTKDQLIYTNKTGIGTPTCYLEQ